MEAKRSILTSLFALVLVFCSFVFSELKGDLEGMKFETNDRGPSCNASVTHGNFYIFQDTTKQRLEPGLAVSLQWCGASMLIKKKKMKK
jgi:hypothetical protein